MTGADWYLVCFVVGMGLSALAFILGALDFHIHFHSPMHVHFGHGLDLGHGPHVPHGPHAPHAGGGGGALAEPELPFFNFGTFTAFLAWFGGMGFLLSRHSHVAAWVALLLSVLAGLVGASFAFLMIAKILIKHDKALDPADYDMNGVLGRTTIPIRAGGTGEIVYVQGGTRRTSGARSEDGEAIPRGEEVVVTRYEKGIAYVRRWTEMFDEVSHELDAGTKK